MEQYLETVKPIGAKAVESHDEFWILRNSHPWTIGDFIKGSITNFGVTMSLTDFFDKLKIAVAALGGTATLQGHWLDKFTFLSSNLYKLVWRHF
ncbi:hypothetical protein SIXOD_v1c09810 [Spiroplasma ixodetis Y32]|nr:hypothetical protein SIXOD_v1c09810 [Spiroplasma ixodetis Y32]